MSYRYESQGRTPKSIAALVGMLLVIAGLEFIGTVWWIVVLVALISLPAALDVLLNVRSSLDLDDERLFWKNRSQDVTIPLFEIEKVRFDGRMDLSTRVTIVLRDGRKLRLPYDALPPHKELESELQSRDVRTERNAFTVL
jgi:virulence-associated protein VagC